MLVFLFRKESISNIVNVFIQNDKIKNSMKFHATYAVSHTSNDHADVENVKSSMSICIFNMKHTTNFCMILKTV